STFVGDVKPENEVSWIDAGLGIHICGVCGAGMRLANEDMAPEKTFEPSKASVTPRGLIETGLKPERAIHHPTFLVLGKLLKLLPNRRLSSFTVLAFVSGLSSIGRMRLRIPCAPSGAIPRKSFQ